MDYCRLEAVPAWIAPLINIWVALAAGDRLADAASPTLFGFVDVPPAHQGRLLLADHPGAAAGRLHPGHQPAAYTGGVVGMTYLAKLELFGHTSSA